MNKAKLIQRIPVVSCALVLACVANSQERVYGGSISIEQQKLTYPIVDTGQERCYDDSKEVEYPKRGQAFFGQDAQYIGNVPVYKDNGDGTVTDLNTSLMWQSDPGEKMTFRQ
ncbi:MAG: hypothetical protein GWN67_01170, partial [Phycisphaerae bacterium]|nr:hypothetical protein [Phycisphaerae bacterium]NIP55588.1 hypothetical protein [Phycisphaerae bacterium]NIS54266.1 hypothetical protein [Phycisphaerae bacterium]NIU11914.1 hypothetical protein [Phycisphaerae bacterium]NIU55046.1 hypothetical protein [Phycisphaerae bacterium]